TLIANLIVIVICSSYENFLTHIDPAKHRDWPERLIKIGFSGLKQKLLGSIAAIAAVGRGVVGVIAGGACIAAAAGVTVGAASVAGDFTFLTEP
ncbi:MAG: YqhA family protein, partial [Pseudolabrys sp.]